MPRRLLERSGSTQRFDVSGSTQRTRRALGGHGLPFVPPDCQPSTINDDQRRLVIYIHGGGWCLGNAMTQPYDSLCSSLSRQLNWRVLSINYRLAPEHPFPTPANAAAPTQPHRPAARQRRLPPRVADALDGGAVCG